MNTNHTQRLLTAIVIGVGLFAVGTAAIGAPQGKGKGKGKANHHNGQQLLGEKLKTNGKHEIDKKGDFTTSVEVKNGKVAGVHVTHAKKGDVAVTKYKTKMKMAQAGGRFVNAAYVLVQDQYLGTTYIGYSYIDDYGNEEIYWFPYDMILDGDTGAVDYVPAY